MRVRGSGVWTLSERSARQYSKSWGGGRVLGARGIWGGSGRPRRFGKGGCDEEIGMDAGRCIRDFARKPLRS